MSSTDISRYYLTVFISTFHSPLNADIMFAATSLASYGSKSVARIFLMILERPGLFSQSTGAVDGTGFSSSISCAVGPLPNMLDATT